MLMPGHRKAIKGSIYKGWGIFQSFTLIQSEYKMLYHEDLELMDKLVSVLCCKRFDGLKEKFLEIDQLMIVPEIKALTSDDTAFAKRGVLKDTIDML